jgi:ComF family protein
VQRLIHAFKYPPFLRDLAKPLALSIIAHINLLNKPIYPPDIICPIPLHKRRLKWRGYNHAEELAKQLGQAFSLPVVADALIKRKHTTPQVSLDREERLRNMKGVFEVQNPQAIAAKNILLVDDVYTTGATMEECARVLKRAGATRVFGAVVARG